MELSRDESSSPELLQCVLFRLLLEAAMAADLLMCSLFLSFRLPFLALTAFRCEEKVGRLHDEADDSSCSSEGR